MKKIIKKGFLAISIALLVLTLVGLTTFSEKVVNYIERQKIARNQKEVEKIIENIPRTTPKEEQRDNPLSLLTEAYLEVPFICQAPLETEANWTLHEESCEEAALLQAYLYETGTTVTKEEANKIILDMIAWEEENMGGHHDLYADRMVEFISGYYSLSKENIEVIYDAEINDLKKTIASGHPAIVPITGDILNNPYYPYPGYHMLTVIGYTGDKIITNDNGTRRGANFVYDTKIFEAAMKDAGGDIIILKDLKKN